VGLVGYRSGFEQYESYETCPGGREAGLCVRLFVELDACLLLTLTCLLLRVLNGDLITGESEFDYFEGLFVFIRSDLDTFRENSTTLIDEIVAPLNAVKVPFSSTHGVSGLSNLPSGLSPEFC
jgi:hypothetical protein